jgi:hypothetical protein
MNELDRETEAQIEKLVEDFRSKITRIVIKNSGKLLKEQAKNFKEELKGASPRRTQVSKQTSSTSKPTSKSKKRDYDTDEDSD